MGGRKCGNTNRGKALSAVKASVPETLQGGTCQRKDQGRQCLCDGWSCADSLPGASIVTRFECQGQPSGAAANDLGRSLPGAAEQPVTRARTGTLSARAKPAARCLLVRGRGHTQPALPYSNRSKLSPGPYPKQSLCKGSNAL